MDMVSAACGASIIAQLVLIVCAQRITHPRHRPNHPPMLVVLGSMVVALLVVVVVMAVVLVVLVVVVVVEVGLVVLVVVVVVEVGLEVGVELQLYIFAHRLLG